MQLGELIGQLRRLTNMDERVEYVAMCLWTKFSKQIPDMPELASWRPIARAAVEAVDEKDRAVRDPT